MGMETWEQVLLGIGAFIILLLFLPGVRRAAKESPKGTREDWMGLIKPLGAVVVFLILVVLVLRN